MQIMHRKAWAGTFPAPHLPGLLSGLTTQVTIPPPSRTHKHPHRGSGTSLPFLPPKCPSDPFASVHLHAPLPSPSPSPLSSSPAAHLDLCSPDCTCLHPVARVGFSNPDLILAVPSSTHSPKPWTPQHSEKKDGCLNQAHGLCRTPHLPICLCSHCAPCHLCKPHSKLPPHCLAWTLFPLFFL